MNKKTFTSPYEGNAYLGEQVTDGHSQNELDARIDRIQMLCEIVDKTTWVAGMTADRIFGPIPCAVGSDKAEEVPHLSTLLELDRALDRMEGYVRRCADNVERFANL